MADVDTSNIKIDSTYSMAEQQTPSLEHSIFAFKIGTNGKPERGTQGWYKIQTLIDTLGKVATDAESGAISAKEAVEEMKTAVEETIASFNTKVTQDNSEWDSKVSTDKSAWASQVSTDLQSLSTALSNALASIGESDSAGARGAAIDAINEALQNALATIGTSDTTGARGEAITAIKTALNNALAAIGQSDSEGARKAALDSINAKATEVNTALDQKLSSANTTIDEKVQTATEKATAAEDAAAAAEESAKEAAAAANAPLADENTAGRMKKYSTTGNNTDGTIHQKGITDAINAAKSELNTSIQNVSGSVSSESSARSAADSTLQTNIDNEASARSSADTTLQGNIDSEASARQRADNSLSSRISALEGAGSGLPIGAVFWWFGTTSNKPSNTLVCDGSSLSSSSYPTLYQKLGKSTLPNITGSKRFIRGSTSAGTTQSDAIRNITGYIETARLGANISSAFYSSGCFSASAGSNAGADKNDSWQTYRISFNASNVVTTSTEVRPTNISAIPLIVAL